jgi:hypothetical protein
MPCMGSTKAWLVKNLHRVDKEFFALKQLKTLLHPIRLAQHLVPAGGGGSRRTRVRSAHGRERMSRRAEGWSETTMRNEMKCKRKN